MRIKGYTIEEVLGERQDVVLLRAVQESLERSVFIKTLRSGAEESVRERFIREANLLGKLNHPNVITIHELRLEEDPPFIVLEFFQGEDLKHRLERLGPLPAPEMVEIARQACRALVAAHTAGIIHGDLKPANLLLGPDGNLKLTDFGFSSLESANATLVQGSPGYLAPELALGDPPSTAADLYSLGMTLYTLARGTNPLLGDDLADSLRLAISMDPETLDGSRPDLPAGFRRLIQELISKDPEDRPGSAQKTLDRIPIPLKAMGPSDENPGLTVAPRIPQKSTGKLQRYTWLLIPLALLLVLAGIRWLPEGEPGQEDPQVLVPDPDLQPRDTLTNFPQKSVTTVPDRMTGEEGPATPAPRLENKSTQTTQVLRLEPASGKGPIAASTGGVGGLMVKAFPWTSFRVEKDSTRFTTPLLKPIEISAGKHRVQFLHPGYPELVRVVEIEEGKTDTVTLNWAKSFGFLAISVSPWAEVYVNSQNYGLTPLPDPIPLQPGEYQVLLKNPAYAPWNRFFNLVAGDTLFLNVRLQATIREQ